MCVTSEPSETSSEIHESSDNSNTNYCETQPRAEWEIKNCCHLNNGAWWRKEVPIMPIRSGKVGQAAGGLSLEKQTKRRLSETIIRPQTPLGLQCQFQSKHTCVYCLHCYCVYSSRFHCVMNILISHWVRLSFVGHSRDGNISKYNIF